MKNILVTIIFFIGCVVGVLGYQFFVGGSSTIHNTSISMDPLQAVKVFKIVSYEVIYKTTIVDAKEKERFFWIFKLMPGTRTTVISYCNKISFGVDMGIDGKNVKVVKRGKSPDTGKEIFDITLPKAKILSHETALNNVYNVIIDKTVYMEKASPSEVIEMLGREKKKAEEFYMEWGALDEAQRNAEQQLSNFLYALPGFKDKYEFNFVKFN